MTYDYDYVNYICVALFLGPALAKRAPHGADIGIGATPCQLTK